MMLGLAALAMFIVIFAWKPARKGHASLGRSAALRAAALTAIFAPSLLPGVHGVLPLPSGLAAFLTVMNTLTGGPTPKLGGEARC